MDMNLRSWREIRVMMKWKFDVLSDADFNFKEDQEESMLDHLAAKLNKTRLELEKLVAEFQKC